MAIYKNDSGKLTSINKSKFDLEKEIQKLTEENLDTIFGLKYVSGSLNREFSVKAQEQDFYIDTLAFDEQEKSFVIIEYKKDRSFSVIDQGFSYLSAMLNNKAEFVLEVNERLEKTYSKDDIDWEQSRLIFISPEFTNYQKNAINFKDLPFFLYEVVAYGGGLVEFDQVKPFRATESINTFTKDKLINEVSQSVKVYDIDDLFKSDWGESRQVFEKARSEILQIDPRISDKVNKNHLVFGIGHKKFCTLVPYKSKVVLDMHRTHPDNLDDPDKKVIYHERSPEYYGQHISHFTITSEDDISYAIYLAKQVFSKTYV